MIAVEVPLGLLVGLAFGYALQRGRFCVNSAFRDVLLIRDATLLRTWALAVAVQLLGLQILLAFQLFEPDVPPLWPAANAVGGFLFGMGMVLAGGCASGTCYRVGEGMLGSLFAFLGFGFMTVVVDAGALRPLQESLRQPVMLDRGPPTLPALLGVPPWTLALAVGLPILAWALRSALRGRGRAPCQRGWPWLFTGLVLGLIGLVAWLSSAAAGRNYGLSITGPIRSWFRYLVTGDPGFLDWGSWMLAGLIVGSFVAARLSGEAKLRLPPPSRTLQALSGGLLMGLGAQLAGGCNIGHGLTGLAVLSLGSVLTTISIVLGAWTMSFLLFMEGLEKLKRALPINAVREGQTQTQLQKEGSR